MLAEDFLPWTLQRLNFLPHTVSGVRRNFRRDAANASKRNPPEYEFEAEPRIPQGVPTSHRVNSIGLSEQAIQMPADAVFPKLGDDRTACVQALGRVHLDARAPHLDGHW